MLITQKSKTCHIFSRTDSLVFFLVQVPKKVSESRWEENSPTEAADDLLCKKVAVRASKAPRAVHKIREKVQKDHTWTSYKTEV